GKTNYVARSENVWDFGAILRVDSDSPAAVCFQTRGLEVQIIDIPLTPDRIQQRVSADHLVTLQFRDHPTAGHLFHAGDLFVQAHGHALVAEVVGECFDDFGIGEFQQTRALFDQDDARSQDREHAGVLHPDHTAAYHDKGAGDFR